MKTNYLPRVAAILIGILFLCAAPASGDELGGKIRGTVTDPSGGVMPGVEVTARNQGTGISKVVTTQSDGSFEFLLLAAPAVYTVSAQRHGFKRYEVTGLPLSLNQTYVLDIQMEVGDLRQTVTVQASTAQVERASMQLGATLSAKTLVDMPLVDGFFWTDLQQTLPGVVASSDRFSGNFATNGSQSQQNSFLINGTDFSFLSLNTPLLLPSADAVAEVRMLTNTMNPEYGRNSGAVISAVLKSGSNAFHGSAFEFYRDMALNTRNFFQSEPDPLHLNVFGGTLGGPIRKDRTFFFVSHRETRARFRQGSGVVSVFTPEERSGFFPALASSTNLSPFPLRGEDGSLYASGTPYNLIFPTGQIPVENFHPISRSLMDEFVPLPNLGTREFTYNPLFRVRTFQDIVRIDHQIGPADLIWGYWLISPIQFTAALSGGNLPGFGQITKMRQQQLTLAWNHNFGGSMLNEVRLGYTRVSGNGGLPENRVLPSELGFTGINPQFPDVASAPRISVLGLFDLGFATNFPQPVTTNTYQFNENLTRIVGRHTLKFGFDMRRYQHTTAFALLNNGAFNFIGSGRFSTGVPGADFLLGIPTNYLQASGRLDDSRWQHYYAYAQDEFKVRPNLALTYGAGWQVDTPIRQLFNGGLSINCFHPGQESGVFPTAPMGLNFPGDPGCDSAGGNTTKLNHLGPRFGFAWSPDAARKWSVRGGFGVYFNRTEEEPNLENALFAVPFSLFSSGIGDVGGSPSFANPFTDITGGFSIPNKFPFSPPQAGSTVDFAFYQPMVISIRDPELTSPYALNYNLTVERELPAATILAVAYVGAQGRKLFTAYELNPGINAAGCAADPVCIDLRNVQNFVFPENFRYPGNVFGSIGFQTTTANSNYNSLQVSVNKRTTHGLDFRAAWTYSHSLDYSSGFENSGFYFRARNPFDQRAEYGDSAFDARHRLVLSYIYDLPSLRRFAAFRRVPRRLIDGWRIAGITTFQTGFPITVGNSDNRALNCAPFFALYFCPDRPDVLARPQIVDPRRSQLVNRTRDPNNSQSLDHYWFDPNTFALAPFGSIGNAGRNFFHGPGINNFDVALMKEVEIKEQTRFQLRFEFFNFFNHTQFLHGSGAAYISGDINSSSFGRVLAAREPRLIQLAAKLYF